MRVFNCPEQRNTRRRLRQDSSKVERILWNRLRAGQMDGLKFRRQYGVGPYIVDFYCARAKLAIEVDGDSHLGDQVHARDLQRQAYIEGYGIQVLRFMNLDVQHRMEHVLEEIWNAVTERIALLRSRPLRKNPPVSPLSKGGAEAAHPGGAEAIHAGGAETARTGDSL